MNAAQWNGLVNDYQQRAMRAEGRAVSAESWNRRLSEALRYVLPGDDCWFDHHGYCQAHYVTSPCEVATAKSVLADFVLEYPEDK